MGHFPPFPIHLAETRDPVLLLLLLRVVEGGGGNTNTYNIQKKSLYQQPRSLAPGRKKEKAKEEKSKAPTIHREKI